MTAAAAAVAPEAAPAAVAAPAAAAPAAAPVVAPAAAAAPAAAPVAAPAAAPVEVAPETYADFTMPEGVKLDAGVLDAFKAEFKGLNLTQAKAQATLDKLLPAMKTRGEAAIAAARDGMLAAAKADKTIGGEKFNESVGLAQLAIEAHFTPEFKKFLNETGLGNHPEMIRGLAKIGAPLKPDGWVPGSKDSNTVGDARSMYPNSRMNP